MTRTIVGVLRGGTSSEYPFSLKTGAAIMAALPQEKYESRDILIDKGGTWHLRGMPSTPAHALTQIDVVLNALHGGIGEDGTVQRLLDRTGIPYAGSRALPSGMSLNKIRAREILTGADISMPRAITFSLHNDMDMDTGAMARAVFSQIGPPYMVKPPAEGSSHGIRHVATIAELPDALGVALDNYGSALVEEYLLGEHVTVGVIELFRNEPLYALPLAHIDMPERMHYFDPHLEGGVRHLVPSRFSHDVKERIAYIARKAHETLQLAHFSDADFVVTRRGPYLLEVNASPHLHEDAAFPKMLEAVGSSLTEFLEHSIALARRGV